MPDYYAILGVDRTVGTDEVKKAFRRLARESHPDANPGDPHAEERFKQLNEAYEVLSDPLKRQRYDTFGDVGAGAGVSGGFSGGGFGFGDLGDIMESFFGGSPFGRARTRPRTSAVAGQDVSVGLRLTLEEAVFGCRQPIELRALARCDRCSGDGCEPGTFRRRCSTCGGTGELRSSRQTLLGTVMTARPCGTCGGAGEAPAVPCTACRGAGRVEKTTTVTLDIPAGVSDGMTLRLHGRGEQGARGGPDGDLFVTVRVLPHEVFEREGDDLVCDLAVPLTQAVLGAEIPVKTLDGDETVRIPPGTRHGTIVTIRGRGAHRLDGRGRGDLLVHVSVEIPTRLDPEQRELFEKLAALRGESVTGEQGGIFRRLRDSLRGQ